MPMLIAMCDENAIAFSDKKRERYGCSFGCVALLRVALLRAYAQCAVVEVQCECISIDTYKAVRHTNNTEQ